MGKQPLMNLLWCAVAIAVAWAGEQLVGRFVDPYHARIIMAAGINITLAVSLNLINGITGQFSLGHAGFYALGAYLSAGLSTKVLMPGLFGAGWASMTGSAYGAKGVLVLIVCMAVGALVAALAGYLVGLPSLRLRGDYLAIVTLGFGEIIRVTLLNMEVFNGPRGILGIPSLAGFFWIYLVAFACIAASRNLLRTAHGLAFLSVREDEVAASAMGINTTKYKVTAFVIGAAFAGIAGVLFAHWDQFIEPDTFKMDISIIIVTMVVIGGQGSITGSIVGAIGLTALLEMLRQLPDIGPASHKIHLADLRMVIFSLALILTMIFRPQGIFGHREFSIDWLRGLAGRRKKGSTAG